MAVLEVSPGPEVIIFSQYLMIRSRGEFFDEPTQYLMTTDKLSYSQVRRYLYLGFTYIYEAKTCSHPKAFDLHPTNVTNDTLANNFKNVVFRTALLGFWESRLDFIWQ